jgi:hypothetical protein
MVSTKNYEQLLSALEVVIDSETSLFHWHYRFIGSSMIFTGIIQWVYDFQCLLFTVFDTALLCLSPSFVLKSLSMWILLLPFTAYVGLFDSAIHVSISKTGRGALNLKRLLANYWTKLYLETRQLLRLISGTFAVLWKYLLSHQLAAARFSYLGVRIINVSICFAVVTRQFAHALWHYWVYVICRSSFTRVRFLTSIASQFKSQLSLSSLIWVF